MKAGEGIELDTIYVRRKTESVKANNYEIEKIIARRIREEGNKRKDIPDQLLELKSLYNSINKYESIDIPYPLQRRNPNYPEDDFDKFILEMIEEKKKLIRENLKKSEF